MPDRATQVPAWRRATALGAALLSHHRAGDGPGEASETINAARIGLSTPPQPVASPEEQAGPGGAALAAVRAAVAATLAALASRLEQVLPPALAAAPQAWDRVDHLVTVFDAALTAQVVQVRQRLEVVAAAPNHPKARAVGLEGLVAIDAACGLARLFEHRLSSLLRLRVRNANHELLPGGRPFLDLAAALKEAARAWASG